MLINLKVLYSTTDICMLTTSDYFHNFYISRCAIFIEKIAIADIIDLYFKYYNI